MTKIKENKTTDTKEKQKKTTPFILGLLLCALSLFLFISCLIYLFKWKQYLSGDGRVGEMGIGMAKICIRAFGAGAFAVPIMLFLTGAQVLRTRKYFARAMAIFILGAVLVSVTMTFLFHIGTAKVWLGNGLGGSFGYFIFNWLNAKVGLIGTGLLLLVAIVAYCLFITTKTMNVIGMIYSRLSVLLKRIFTVKRQKSGQIKKLSKETKEPVEEKEENAEKPAAAAAEPLDSPAALHTDPGFEVIISGNKNESEKPYEDESEEPNVSPAATASSQSGEDEGDEEDFPEGFLSDEPYDPTGDLSGYQYPSIDLLKDYQTSGDKIDMDELKKNKDKIVEILEQYKVTILRIQATVGPTVTLYEIVPKAGILISQIRRLEDDIALRLMAKGVRIIAPMPGKGTVGIEVPNTKADIVSMLSIIKSEKYQKSKFELPVVLGKTIVGEVYSFDLVKMPHLLIAGATGQGKSVGLNAILTSLLYKKHPSELKIVMIDPKKVELTPYNKIEKHFLAKLPDADEPIITDTEKAKSTLKSLCMEMDHRYDLLKKAGVRNVKEYNEKFVKRRLNPLKGHKYMPYILLVIDEFADLIMTAGKEIEMPIARLAQLARAVGIHLIIATQRPTTNIITGLIKANFPARIAFRVTSHVDSKTILDTVGANRLIGYGDMLVSAGSSELIRVQCAFVDTPEVDRVTDFIRSQPGYPAAHELPEYADEKSADKQIDMRDLDPMFEESAKLVVINQNGSTSLIQRKLSLGYNRAGRIMDQLQAAGIVGPPDGSKPRQVLITDLLSLDAILTAFKK
jgi:S-DNA-T family DNA segregation ATPase FtsK/SpoIIIE